MRWEEGKGKEEKRKGRKEQETKKEKGGRREAAPDILVRTIPYLPGSIGGSVCVWVDRAIRRFRERQARKPQASRLKVPKRRSTQRMAEREGKSGWPMEGEPGIESVQG